MRWNVPTIGEPVFKVESPHPGYCCEEAAIFAGWIDGMIDKLLVDDKLPSKREAQRAVFDLSTRYFAMHQVCTAEHRDRRANRRGDLCVYGVFMSNLEDLLNLAVFAEPDVIEREASAPASKPTYLIHGIPLGLFEEASKEFD